MIREGNEVGAPSIPFKIGTSVVIKEFTKISDDLFYIVIQGERRFRIDHFVQEQPHIIVEIEWLDNEIPSFPGDYSVLHNIITDMLEDKCKIPEDNNEFFGFLGKLMTLHPGGKQKVLELSNEKVVPALTRLLESM
jgi:Lon protease-like protein